jgi:ketosteroid isomerase-like protein
MSRPAITALLLLASCAPTAAPPTTPTPTAAPAPPTRVELSGALAPLAWWLGDWDATDGSGSEHWIAAAGAIYGVALHGDSFEVLVIDDGDGPGRPDGVLRLLAMPGGLRSVEFRQRTIADAAATFANDQHDFPKTITYRLTPDRSGLSAVLGGGEQLAFELRRGTRTPAPELEAADLAFAAATGQRGVQGWVAAFDPEGGMMGAAGRVDRAALAEVMTPTLTSGRLDRAPIASGRSGELGFTIGTARFTPSEPGAGWRRSYVTIWRRQPDGTWKVLFDTGRPVHAT